jgi:hypothetical protein
VNSVLYYERFTKAMTIKIKKKAHYQDYSHLAFPIKEISLKYYSERISRVHLSRNLGSITFVVSG